MLACLLFNLGIKRHIEKFTFHFLNWYQFSFETKFLYRLYKLLDNHFTNRIFFHYGADYRWNDQRSQNLDKDTFNQGYGLAHYALIRNQKPKNLLCIGSMYGYIPYMMSKACEENGYGKVDFVDAGYDIDDSNDRARHNFGLGFWKKHNVKKHFSYLLDNSYIDFHLMRSQDFAKKTKKKYDYIYIDGGHWYAQAKEDFSLFWPKLKEEGFLVFHDIHYEVVSKGIPFEYWKLWEELIEEFGFKFELSNHYSGLGFI